LRDSHIAGRASRSFINPIRELIKWMSPIYRADLVLAEVRAPQKEGVRRSQQVYELWQPVARPPRAKTAATRSARILRTLITFASSTRARAPLPRTVAASSTKADANVTGALVSSWRPAVGLEDAIEVPGAGLGSIPEEGVDESVPPSRRLGLLRWESRRARERGLAQGMVACTSS
jgi:hypothetical protein